MISRSYSKAQIKAAAAAQKAAGLQRMKESERDGLIEVLIAYQILRDAQEKIMQRVKGIKMGLCRMRCAEKHLDNLCNQLVATVPVDQLSTVQHDMKLATYKIGWYRPLNTRDEFGMWLSYTQLETVLKAVDDHCLTCDRDVQAQQKCPLRKIMNSLPNKAVDVTDNGKECPYYGIV